MQLASLLADVGILDTQHLYPWVGELVLNTPGWLEAREGHS